MLDLRLSVINLKKCKQLKKKKKKKKTDEELMPVAWHPTRVWDWCMTKNGTLWNDKSNA